MKRLKTRQHNYEPKLRYLTQIGALPRTVGLHQVRVDHNAWCGIFEEWRCNCDPEVRLK